jgi:hypothetical protein
MRKINRNHQTQWAAQFAVASELCKMGYEVSFTLGHSAPLADLVAISPDTKKTLLIDVKGLSARNSWIVQPKPPRNNLYYVLAYVPLKSSNAFFVFSQRSMNRYIRGELLRLKRPAEYRVKGVSWTVAQRSGAELPTLPR